MSSKINNRKLDHVNIVAEDSSVDRAGNYFDEIQLPVRALPEIDFDSVDPRIEFLGKELSMPLLISSMTGGTTSELVKVNQNLAKAAEATGVAMGVGSQRIVFEDDSAKKSFELRKYAPNVPLIANLGAVQLNYGFTAKHCQEVVDILEADALYLHLNALQEVIQTEGNTNFSNLIDRISEVVSELSVPVMIKEVGAGITAEDTKLLYEAGVRYIDVAGTGGTSWSRIEHLRKQKPKDQLGILFQDWGMPTPEAISEIFALQLSDLTLISSGGVRNGIDILKSICLGANLAGMAKPFLKPAMNSDKQVVQVIEQIYDEFKTAMFLCGIASLYQE